MGAREGKAVSAYAAALRKALDGYLAGGGTQKDLAKAIGTSPTSVTRHLQGKRITPRKQLRAIKAFLEAQGFPCPDEVWAELEDLCGQAHLASDCPIVQRDHLEEELARACAEHQRARWDAEQQHGLQQRADRLAEDLRQAQASAQRAERTRRILQERVSVQDQKLLKATCYIHNVEAELAHHKEQAGLLNTENAVLREQNRRLVEEQTAVPAPQYIYIPLQPSPVVQAAATARVTGAAALLQGQVSLHGLAVAGAVAPYGTGPLHEQDQYGYGYRTTPEQHPYNAMPYDTAGTQAAPHGYQDDATTRSYPQQDAYVWEAWAAAPHATSSYDAWHSEGSTAGPLLAPANAGPSLHTSAASPGNLPHPHDENAQQPAPAARSNRAAPPRRRAGVVPTLTLLAFLVGSRLL
ncbi:hypothetical protein ADK53_07515 [Streptomyces sp. WM6373]|uniref:helix-turn-helix domain-containing protein n=1 Tax=Streptomyces sp. WM6373 TaxID=1415556 RepID=UPI0006AE882A|nr:transcriptional regulator [Streptomyces sp. WM6373]KOU42639.1 hypothetical protein ADK53_07515 [Streptomyces sp. WM6373]